MITTKLYKGTVVLDFDDEATGYKPRYKINGRPIQSVTTFTGIIDKSRPLIYWATGLTRDFLRAHVTDLMSDEARAFSLIDEACKLHQVKKQEAADTGTQIHAWVEQYIKSDGKETTLPKEPQVYNGVTAFLKWVSENNIRFIASEKRLYSKKYDYAGTMDAEAVVNRKRCVIDFKSSNAIYPEMRLQVAAYQAADEEETGKKYSGNRLLVRFGKDNGEFEVHELPDQEKDFEAFVSCLTLKRRLQEIKK